MSIFPGNMVYRVLFLPQFRSFFIVCPHKIQKKAAAFCSTESKRDFSSSKVPVRYIPKKSLKPNNPKRCDNLELGPPSFHDSASSFVVEEKRHFGKDMDQDDTFFFDTSHYVESSTDNAKPSLELEELDDCFGVESITNNAEPSLELEELDDCFGVNNQQLEHQEEVGSWQEEHIIKQNKGVRKTMQDAEKLVTKLLARRAFTAVEVRNKLLGKRFSPDIVESIIANFQNRGIINDSLYAETYSRSRWSSSSWGPRRIKQALSKKGVSEGDVENAIKLVFKHGESGDEESKLGMSKLSMDRLLVQASKQWLRSLDISKETRKARIVRWLQYRGFNWGVTSFVLKKLESQYPP